MPPAPTVIGWLGQNVGLAERYARARQRQYEGWAEDLLEISDDPSRGDAQERRLQVDTRKWLLSKLLPKQYGDKIDVNTTVTLRAPIEMTDAEILAELGGGTQSLHKPSNPPILEHQPNSTPLSAHTKDSHE
jgi:hypothetical protein